MDCAYLRYTCLSLAFAALAGCGSDAATDSQPSSQAAPASPGVVLISEEDFGERWPFTQPEMHLSCLPGKAVVVMDVNTGAMYPINGVASSKAQQMGMEPLETVWREHPELEGLRVDIGPVIQQGLGLCR